MTVHTTGLFLVSVLLSCHAEPTTPAEPSAVYVSSTAGDRISQKPNLSFRVARAFEQPNFQINPDIRHQTILGFGASFLEAGLVTLNTLPPTQQENVLKSIFDPSEGAGFSAMKTVIGGTDFQSAEPNFYTYAEGKQTDLSNFSIARDLKPNGLVTYIKRAKQYGSFMLQAPMDFPPDWMLVGQAKEQNVDPQYYDELALYYLKYLQEYEKQSIHIEYLSPFNEPGIYTKINAQEISNLIRNHVGPLFAANHIKTKLQVSDFATRNFAANDVPVILNDPNTRQYVSGISYHGYDMVTQTNTPTRENGYNFAEFQAVANLSKSYPDLPLWQSEVCYFLGTPWVQNPVTDFADGDFWGQQIMADLEAGASAWTYWNMILNEQGGPWLVAPDKVNAEYNPQTPLVIIDRKTQQVTYNGAFYYLAHFSKFIRPGSVRLELTGNATDIKALAFIRPDGKTVVEIVNSRKTNTSMSLQYNNLVLDVPLPASSISTLLW
jgi:glucosylceramidase